MFWKSRGGKGALYVFFATLLLVVSVQGTFAQSLLTLRNPENISAQVQRSVTSSINYTVFITFDDIPRDLGTIIHDPDLRNWSYVTPADQLSVVSVADKQGYRGTIDRTISFRALSGGMVGTAENIQIQYSIRGEERWQNTINIGRTYYTPGDPQPIIFRDSFGDSLDLGIELAFSEGIVDSNGVFFLGCEDFEGYHIWRGVMTGDGGITNIEAIGEISKEESFDNMFCDSLYFNGMVPELRRTGRYAFTPGLTCFNNARDTVINLPLADNRLFWVDYNTFNGFTYAYAVSTFDRGYNVSSSRQGLRKLDSFAYCESDSVIADVPCPDLFHPVSIEVQPQEVLKKVYAVPNPYRSGSSVFTTPNYHNYPDNKIRFVNVPPDCTLEIYTAAGDRVWETEHHDQTGNIEWDTKNDGGEEVTSGIYIYKLEDSSGGSVYGRLVIIR